MLIDILSPANNGSYNKKLARLTNLQTACYWNMLMEVISRVVKKNKFTPDGYFKLDRKYITDQIGLSALEQKECDEILSKLGVITVNKTDSDLLGVHCDIMISILTEENVKNLKAIYTVATKATKEEKAETKKTAIISRLQNSIVETDADLLQAYKDWVVACYGRITTIPQIKIFKEAVESYSSDKQIKLAIIKIGIARQYKECAWCIRVYETENKPKASRLGEQKKDIGRSDIEF